MRKRGVLMVLLAVPVLLLLAVLLLHTFFQTYDRVTGALPEQAEAQVHLEARLQTIVEATLQAMQIQAQSETATASALPTLTPTPIPSSPTPSWTPTPLPSEPPLPTPTATPVPTETHFPTLVPEYIALSGVRNQVETRNNCGPATLAMALSYWGWQGDQTVPQAVLRPNSQVDDKNVMPVELVQYTHAYTNFQAIVRVGGDLDILKRLISAGFPVIVEKGHITTGWIGHYVLLTGYDDNNRRFLTQDSLIVSPNHPMAYDYLIENWWRHFNYLYLVVYPPDREAELLSLLGPHADPIHNFNMSSERARQEIGQAQGRELFFAWYNLGSSLAGLGDYEAAAQAFDAAYYDVYPHLSGDQRPWRALWYQTDPYLTYYAVGRYEEVIRLADTTMQATGSAVLEESFYWRGKAREALGNLDGAVADYRQAYRLNPYSTPALSELQRLGLE